MFPILRRYLGIRLPFARHGIPGGYGSCQAEGEGWGRRLGDDRKRANLLFSQLSFGSIGPDVISTDISTISYAERRRIHVALIGILSYRVLSVLHAVAQELVNFIEVDSESFSPSVGYFCVWVNSNQRVVAASWEEGGDFRRGMGSAIICELS